MRAYLLILLALSLGLFLNGCGTAAAVKPDASIVTVSKGDLEDKIEASGRVVANLEVDIKCKASGTVTSVPVNTSDQVKIGDLLLQLDPVDEQRQLDITQANLTMSEARLAQAEQSLAISQADLVTSTARAKANLASAQSRAVDAAAKANRQDQLLALKMVSTEEADALRSASAQADAALASAQADVLALKSQELGIELKRQDVALSSAQVKVNQLSLEQAKQGLKEVTVRAPMTGVVTSRNVQVGNIISSGITNVGGGTTVMTIADVSSLYVYTSVTEADIGKVKLEQPARVTVDAYRRKVFNGKVARIAPKGVNVSNVVTFEVQILLDKEGLHLLKPEMTTSVTIIAASVKDVVLVSADALVRKQGQWTAKVIAADNSETERPVKVGISDGEQTEITEGLQPGEKVRTNAGGKASAWRAGAANRMGGGPPGMGG